MNPIVEEAISNNPNYCHAVEVHDVTELEAFLEAFYDTYIKTYAIEIIIDFCTSLSLYCLDDANEEEVFNFEIVKFLNQLN